LKIHSAKVNDVIIKFSTLQKNNKENIWKTKK